VLASITMLAMALLAVAAFLDFKQRKIPNWVSGSVFLLYLAFLIVQWATGLDPQILPPLGSAITGFGVLVVFAGLFYFNLIGGGDVKLISALAFWAGPAQIAAFLVIMALSGGILAIFYIFFQNRSGDFGKENAEPGAPEKVITKESQVIYNKNKNKSGNLPYGIAISIGGLFIVNRILTILIA